MIERKYPLAWPDNEARTPGHQKRFKSLFSTSMGKTLDQLERKPGRAPGPYQRNGKTIYPWAEEHDAFILELRAQGINKQEIWRRVTAKFGIVRNHHQVDVRLVLLAAAPEEHL